MRDKRYCNNIGLDPELALWPDKVVFYTNNSRSVSKYAHCKFGNYEIVWLLNLVSIIFSTERMLLSNLQILIGAFRDTIEANELEKKKNSYVPFQEIQFIVTIEISLLCIK
ncbi:hypothetical protein BDF21DRAFT_455595 [Thamnidium elegans]|nr:hypothetical protein BDF21DRAFT_455595 [Thamnidium elegans]